MVMLNKRKFIVVFDKETKDALVSAGLSMVKSDDRNGTYVFVNPKSCCDQSGKFSVSLCMAAGDILDGKSFLASDTLTF